MLVVVVPDEPVVVCAAVVVCSVVATAVVPAAVVPAAPVVSELNVLSIPTHSQDVWRIMLSIRHDISILNDLDTAVSNYLDGRWRPFEQAYLSMLLQSLKGSVNLTSAHIRKTCHI